jgi:cell division protein FtsI/penicillin-binding protein 2
MPPYCTSSVIGRRDFLKVLVGLTSLSVLFPHGTIQAAKLKKEKANSWDAPIWIMDIASGAILESQRSASLIKTPAYGMPGSIMKLITATALLQENLLSPNQQFHCNGTIRLHEHASHCPHPHGALTLQEALGYSCNVFFAQAMQPLSNSCWLDYAQRFQLDRPLRDGEPFEFQATDAKHQPVQMLGLGLSSAIQPNALQLLRLARSIARRNIPSIHASTWNLLQQGMRLSARRGTAQQLDPPDRFKLAAKTGTAPHGQRFNSWLIGYFPFEKPRFAFCARAQAGTAKDSAVPMMRQFLLRGTFNA